MGAKVFANAIGHVLFSTEGPQPTPLLVEDELKVVVGGLQAGQMIPPHPEGQAVYYILQGKGVMIVNDKEYPIEVGDIIIVDRGDVRGVKAESDLAFLAVRVTAPPEEA